MLIRQAEQPRILLVIAPTMIECRRTADAFGIDPMHFGSCRTVKKVQNLRGWRRGTPFITQNRETWSRRSECRDLDAALTALTLSGHLRIASEGDLVELRTRENA